MDCSRTNTYLELIARLVFLTDRECNDGWFVSAVVILPPSLDCPLPRISFIQLTISYSFYGRSYITIKTFQKSNRYEDTSNNWANTFKSAKNIFLWWLILLIPPTLSDQQRLPRNVRSTHWPMNERLCVLVDYSHIKKQRLFVDDY